MLNKYLLPMINPKLIQLIFECFDLSAVHIVAFVLVFFKLNQKYVPILYSVIHLSLFTHTFVLIFSQLTLTKFGLLIKCKQLFTQIIIINFHVPFKTYVEYVAEKVYILISCFVILSNFSYCQKSISYALEHRQHQMSLTFLLDLQNTVEQ